METVFYFLFGIEGFYDSKAAQAFLDVRHQYAPLVLLLK